MTKQKGIIYSAIMAITFIGELVFLILALQEVNYMFLVGVGAFYIAQAALAGSIFAEAVYKENSESH